MLLHVYCLLHAGTLTAARQQQASPQNSGGSNKTRRQSVIVTDIFLTSEPQVFTV
jgi:hypothetical protein